MSFLKVKVKFDLAKMTNGRPDALACRSPVAGLKLLLAALLSQGVARAGGRFFTPDGHADASPKGFVSTPGNEQSFACLANV